MSNPEELIDTYDGQGRPTGTASPRSDVHRDGLWHKTFHCWFLVRDADRACVLLQLRGDTGSWPNKLDVTAAGHYLSGETIRDGLREVQEELGISVPYESLTPLGTRVCVEEFQPGKLNHEFQDVFLLVTDKSLVDLNLHPNPSEIHALVTLPIPDALALFSGNQTEVTGNLYDALTTTPDPSAGPGKIRITLESFIPSLDNYNYKVIILANRALHMEPHLLI